MKKFKLIDFAVQVALIIGFAFASIIKMDWTFILGYLVIGSWQLLSMLVHFLKNWFSEKGLRYYYHIVVLLIISVMVFAFVFHFLFFFYYIMLFISPFLALFYTWLCYDEIWHKMIRPLAILK